MTTAPNRDNLPIVSFEFFPPKNQAMERTLMDTVHRLEPLGPRFVSVTYGAGGSTRDKTLETILRIHRETRVPAAAHLTCVGAPRAEIDAIADNYWDQGVRHIVALRGDAQGDGPYRPHRQGYAYADDLVAGLKARHDFEVSVAAYPEAHPDAGDPKADLDHLKRKLDAGADRAITQFFFDPALFLRFRDQAAAAGIAAPIVPGVLPITNFARAAKFAAMCGASVPDWIEDLFDGLDEDPETRTLVAATVAAELCQTLQAEGVDEFHFYTLNRAELTMAICRRLGLKARPTEASAAA